MATWCHGCSLSLGEYGFHERDWGAYTQGLAKFSIKRCGIVGKTTYGSLIGVGNSFYMPIGRYEWNQQLVTWLFIAPWIIWYPHTRLLERCLKKYQTTAQNNVVPLFVQYMIPQEVMQKIFLPIVMLEWDKNLVPWLCIEPWIILYPRTGFGSIHSKIS